MKEKKKKRKAERPLEDEGEQLPGYTTTPQETLEGQK